MMKPIRVWLKTARGRYWFDKVWGCWEDVAEAVDASRALGCHWQVEAMVNHRDVIIAEKRTDAPGTMAALYAAGKLGSASACASYLASKATDSEVTP